MTSASAGGNCVLTGPAVFDQDDEEGLVVRLTAEVPPQDADDQPGHVEVSTA